MDESLEPKEQKEKKKKKKHVIKINDNKLIIEINNDEITFILMKGISYSKYIKKYKYNGIKKELNIECNDINDIFEHLMNSEYKINNKEKKIIINNDKEIELTEKTMSNEEVIKILIHEINYMKEENNKQNEEIKGLKRVNEDKDIRIDLLESEINELKEQMYELVDNKTSKYRNEINIIYKTEEAGNCDIFGKKFVEINKDKIELNIDGNQIKLINEYKLKKGDNNIKMVIKSKITDLQYMFHCCKNLKDINELQYLDTKYCNNFKFMFARCSLLSDIRALEKWNVSNGNNFEGMFAGCSSLSDIKPLHKWKVSNCNNFELMFYECKSLSDISAMENWKVFNCINFSGMFRFCTSLADIKALEKWKVSKGSNFSYMFCGCSSLANINPLENWSVYNGNTFEGMFYECKLLSNISALENWDVSKGKNFSYMFFRCSPVLDIKPLEKWNIVKSLLNNIR
jgi:hypothetical protein